VGRCDSGRLPLAGPDRLNVAAQQPVTFVARSAGFGEPCSARTAKPHFASAAAQRIAEDPRFSAALADLQVQAAAVGVIAGLLELLNLDCRELIDGRSHATSPCYLLAP